MQRITVIALVGCLLLPGLARAGCEIEPPSDVSSHFEFFRVEIDILAAIHATRPVAVPSGKASVAALKQGRAALECASEAVTPFLKGEGEVALMAQLFQTLFANLVAKIDSLLPTLEAGGKYEERNLWLPLYGAVVNSLELLYRKHKKYGRQPALGLGQATELDNRLVSKLGKIVKTRPGTNKGNPAQVAGSMLHERLGFKFSR